MLKLILAAVGLGLSALAFAAPDLYLAAPFAAPEQSGLGITLVLGIAAVIGIRQKKYR